VTTVVMPRLSDAMEQGTVVRWLKADGDRVEVGEELVEIETDKATMPYEAESAGILRRLAAEATPSTSAPRSPSCCPPTETAASPPRRSPGVSPRTWASTSRRSPRARVRAGAS
jgi:pyruvate dehydrogenase E2 component (dihydrolipoamide acetyltransferase)